MSIDRRHFLAATTATGAFTASEAIAAPSASSIPISGLGIDAFHLGVRTNSADDQTEILQRAVDRTAGARLPLILPPGVYRVRALILPTGARLIGVPGATRIVALDSTPLVVARNADHILLSGITFDGSGRSLPEDAGLIQVAMGRDIAIHDCEIVGSGRNGIVLEAIEGEVSGNTITGALGAAIFSVEARGLVIARNTIRNAANNGIQVWRSQAGDDGTQVIDNRIEDTAAQSGGSGQNGNAINVFRAHNVTVRGNRIKNAAFSAVRGNAASNIQITNNTCT
ncbi:MAG: TIGR03808 family TAT-translocated repetitive protein, partial [Alphaproteobacteria bacterium]|nr:TIGR03808 family TAT-translocated repetitive protein [Alphaproteobacteria bacterium]